MVVQSLLDSLWRSATAALVALALTACAGSQLSEPVVFRVSPDPATPTAPAPKASPAATAPSSIPKAKAAPVIASSSAPAIGAGTGAKAVSQEPPKEVFGTVLTKTIPVASEDGATLAMVDGAGLSLVSTASPKISHDGSAAYHVPLKMVESKASFVELWLDRATPVQELKAQLAKHLQLTEDRIMVRSGRAAEAASGKSVIYEIDGLARVKIGDMMSALLSGGEDFNIEPKDAVTQSLKGESRAMWSWRVTPKRASEVVGLPLVLEVWIDPGPNQRRIESIREEVFVTARPLTFWEWLKEFDEWLTLLGAGGVAGVIGVLWKWLAGRRKDEKDSSEKEVAIAGNGAKGVGS